MALLTLDFLQLRSDIVKLMRYVLQMFLEPFFQSFSFLEEQLVYIQQGFLDPFTSILNSCEERTMSLGH